MPLQWVLSVILIGVTLADDNSSTSFSGTLENFFLGVPGDKYASAPTPELLTSNNYTVEIHHVKTEDDYILEMHRIPGGPTCPPANNKPVAFLMHGLFSTSADWIVSGPGLSVAYLLADAGYDIWLGNARGSPYSMNNSRTLSDEEFWAFSWHEIGYYDIPAMIDYALAETGQKQVVYLGHSQGTTSFYVMASMRPEYNDKIKAMFSLAPIAYMGRIFNPFLQLLSRATTLIETSFHLTGTYKIFDFSHLSHKTISDICSHYFIAKLVCQNVLFLFGGFDEPQLEVDLIPVIFGHFPSTSSVGQFVHYGQEVLSHKFRQYDLGETENMKRYGSAEPPDYDLSLITAPVYIFYGENDWVSSLPDVTQLYNELGNSIEIIHVRNPKWEHFDYVYAKDAKTMVFEPIVNRLAKSYGLPSSCPI